MQECLGVLTQRCSVRRRIRGSAGLGGYVRIVTIRATEAMFQFCVSERSSFGNAWSHALAGSALRAVGTLVGRFLDQPVSALV